MADIGTGVGIIITETEAVLDRLPLAVLQGLAGGALLYTLLFRVLARERLRTVPGVVQVLGVILGFLVIMIVEIIGRKYCCTELIRDIYYLKGIGDSSTSRRC